jgi:hypothetical protein
MWMFLTSTYRSIKRTFDLWNQRFEGKIWDQLSWWRKLTRQSNVSLLNENSALEELIRMGDSPWSRESKGSFKVSWSVHALVILHVFGDPWIFWIYFEGWSYGSRIPALLCIDPLLWVQNLSWQLEWIFLWLPARRMLADWAQRQI